MSALTKRPAVLGSGFVALDIVLSSNAGVPIHNYAGGTCGNVLTILSFLGWDACPIARIGTDTASVFLLSDLERWKVRTELLQKDDAALTPVIVQQNRRAESGGVSHHFSWRCPGCGSYWPSFRPPTRKSVEALAPKMRKHKSFFFDRASSGTILMAEISRSVGAVVFFEPSSVGDEKVLQRAVKASTIVKYSADRLKMLPGRQRPPLEIRTRGSDGLEFRLPGARKWRHLPAVRARAVMDTSGSGDWLSAGFIKGSCGAGRTGFDRLTEEQLVSAMRFGQALAAWNCQFEGARGAMYHTPAPSVLIKRVRALLAGRDKKLAASAMNVAALAMSGFGDLCRACSSWDAVNGAAEYQAIGRQ